MISKQKQGCFAAKGLDSEQLAQILRLAEVCRTSDGFDAPVVLNLSALEHRPNDRCNDFLYYHRGECIGYLAMFAIVREDQLEWSGMVHPEHRRKGIFRNLYEMANEESAKRKVKLINRADLRLPPVTTITQ